MRLCDAQEEEARAVEVESRVRRQVEARARRQGAEEARRELNETLMHAEEHARVATLAAEEKALKLQAELNSMQQRVEEAEAQNAILASASAYGGSVYSSDVEELLDDDDDDDDAGGEGGEGGARAEAAVEAAVRRVEAVTREENAHMAWARRAVEASGDFPSLPAPITAMAVGGGPGDEAPHGEGGEGALAELVKWVCIRVPRGRTGGTSVLMDTPYGRFAVLIPLGLPPGTPLLVPVPASGAPTQIGHAAPGMAAERDAAKEEQLQALLERGFAAAEAAGYCDGVTPVDELVETIRDDADTLEHTELDACAEGDTPRVVETPRAGAGRSNICVVS